MVIYVDVKWGPNLSCGADTWAQEVVQMARPSPPPTKKIHRDIFTSQKNNLEELSTMLLL